jgi:hypothetical protein
MAVHITYKFLEPRPASNYRQLFLRGRNLRAEVLYRATIGPEPRTPAEVAHDYGVPLEAVKAVLSQEIRRETPAKGNVPMTRFSGTGGQAWWYPVSSGNGGQR